MADEHVDTMATAEAPAGSEAPAEWRWDVFWFCAIVAVALVLRLIYVLQLRSSPYFATHVMDPHYHDEWARAFAAGERFWDGPYFRAPLYPWFLGVIYKVFGADNALAPRIVQAVIGSLSCGLLYVLGRQTFSRVTGAIAGLAGATYWIFLYYDAELLIPVLIVFLDLLLLVLLVRAGRRGGPPAWGLCGLVLGLSAIARPNILLLAPPLVFWVFVLQWGRWRRALGYSLCLFVGTMLPILPITIRNYVVGHELVLIASQGGVNFYIGNNPDSDGMSAVIKGDPPQWLPCYNAQIERAERAAGRKLSASEVSRWYYGEALRFMRENPRQAAALMLEKLGYFWSYWETGNNQDIRFITSRYTPIVRFLPLGFGIVAPLGVLGLVLSLRRAKELFPLWMFVLVYMLSVVMFFVTARYRVPVVAVLMVLGAHAWCWLAGTLRARRWWPAGLALVVLAAMSWVAWRTPPGVDRGMVQGYRAAGMLLAQRGDDAEAERLLDESMKRAEATGWPVDADSWYFLGHLRLKRQRMAEAAECFAKAVRVKPDHADARNALAAILASQGKLRKAAKHLEYLVERNPQDAVALANLGAVYARLGRIDEAIARLLRAIELDSANRRVLVETADALRRGGNADGARRLLEAGRGRFPELFGR